MGYTLNVKYSQAKDFELSLTANIYKLKVFVKKNDLIKLQKFKNTFMFVKYEKKVIISSKTFYSNQQIL